MYSVKCSKTNACNISISDIKKSKKKKNLIPPILPPKMSTFVEIVLGTALIFSKLSYLVLTTYILIIMIYVMNFEWDDQKNIMNIHKHGISFEEARGIFDDPLHISILDKRFSYFEERWISIGQSNRQKLLVVANLFFDESGEGIIRIISAREATIHEQKQYETYR